MLVASLWPVADASTSRLMQVRLMQESYHIRQSSPGMTKPRGTARRTTGPVARDYERPGEPTYEAAGASTETPGIDP